MRLKKRSGEKGRTMEEYVVRTAFIDPKDCRSTHGGAGYAAGSYKDGDVMVCGTCGTRIENPSPRYHTYAHYTFKEALKSWKVFKAWIRNEIKSTNPVW